MVAFHSAPAAPRVKEKLAFAPLPFISFPQALITL